MPEKSWWQSKTVWGGAVALIAGAAGLLGFNIGPEDQAALIDSLYAIASAVGGLLAIVGRVKASKRIK